MHDTSDQDSYREPCSCGAASCGPAEPAQADCAGDWPASSPKPFRRCLQSTTPPHCRDCVDPVAYVEEFQSLLHIHIHSLGRETKVVFYAGVAPHLKQQVSFLF